MPQKPKTKKPKTPPGTRAKKYAELHSPAYPVRINFKLKNFQP